MPYILEKIAVNQKTGIILADATQIHQVIINICTNAGHAMEADGGILSIIVDKRSLAKKIRTNRLKSFLVNMPASLSLIPVKV